jgi:leucyl aminopeptidase (aminopeptidase T)
MTQALMFKGARTIMDDCVSLKKGERLCIVTDAHKLHIAQVLAAAGIERGAETVLLVMEPRAKAGQEPPDAIAHAMRHSDVVLCPVGRSITHTYAVKEAAKAGARILVMTDFTDETLVRGGIEADFKAVKPVCKGMAEAFARGNSLHIQSPGGTDLRVDISGRRGNALYCIVEPGEFSTVPTVEANVSPVEGSASGRIVADASIPYLGIGLLDEPVIADVSGGYITSISGGKQAATLLRDLESHGDRNCFNIAEVGLGLNPKCRMIGVMLEDEGVVGSAHIGIGTSIQLGGTIKAPMHYDLLMWNPTITIDGTIVFEGTETRI